MKIKQLFMVLLLALSLNAYAEVAPFSVHETSKLKIKLSDDGTGIVQDVWCRGCDFKIVKITKNSKATVNGKQVDIFEARSRAGKSAMVSFDPNTREVQFIRWSE